jgi:hypothetical protein
MLEGEIAMNRLFSLVAVAVASAATTYAVREMMLRTERRRALAGGHPGLDTWESEGGNLAPYAQPWGTASHAARPLQQRLG